MFAANDSVKCVDASNSQGRLTLNEEYTCIWVSTAGMAIQVGGQQTRWNADRFVPSEEELEVMVIVDPDAELKDWAEDHPGYAYEFVECCGVSTVSFDGARINKYSISNLENTGTMRGMAIVIMTPEQMQDGAGPVLEAAGYSVFAKSLATDGVRVLTSFFKVYNPAPGV